MVEKQSVRRKEIAVFKTENWLGCRDFVLETEEVKILNSTETRLKAENALSAFSIKSIKTEYYRVPLAEPLVDASHGTHTFFELIVCRITGDNGIEGVGYTYTGGSGGRAIYSILADDLKPRILGKDGSDIDGIWRSMQKDLHYVGRGGILSFAISAVDIALWDIRCKSLNAPLWKVLNAPSNKAACYAGFIDLHLSGDDLKGLVKKHLDLGHTSVKTKVGRADVSEDVQRVADIRSVLGDDKPLMVDANWSYETGKAIEFGKAVRDYDISWFEEPISPDEFEDYAIIAEATGIPLAMGENFHIIEEFERAIKYAGLTYLQPDCSNIGGITGFLKVADLAAEAGLKVCSHGMHELHVSLLAAQPHAGLLEIHSFPIDQYTISPIEIRDGYAFAPDHVGTGVVFDEALLKPHLISEI